MTTIATDGNSMAGDGLCTGNGLKHGFATQKVFRCSDGRIFGFAGNAYSLPPFREWMDGGCAGELALKDAGFEALILYPDGSVRTCDEHGRLIEQEYPAATGSGSALALGAMMAGASPEQAVVIACSRDCGSGGRVSVEHRKTNLKEVA